jgi:hypothetical protein
MEESRTAKWLDSDSVSRTVDVLRTPLDIARQERGLLSFFVRLHCALPDLLRRIFIGSSTAKNRLWLSAQSRFSPELLSEGAFPALFHDLTVEQFPHLRWRPELPISPWVMRIFNTLDTRPYGSTWLV